MLASIEGVPETRLRGPAMHSGNVERSDGEPETGKVFVRLQGACVGCPMSEMTLKAGIEDTLLSMVPGLTEVVNVDATDEDSDACCAHGPEEEATTQQTPA